MTKKIFNAILLVASIILLSCFLIILGVLYEHFTGVQSKQLKIQTDLIARGVAGEGKDYIEGLDAGDYRITWIDENGSVLYDSKSDSTLMENHADREEFTEALKSGYGESVRYSSTLTEKMLYYAQKLPDGSVIRVAFAQNTVLSLVFGMIQPIFIVLAVAIILSAVLASRLSKRIVRPLNDLDLDHPLENEAYDEIAPLLRRIDYQSRQISEQMDKLKQKQDEWDAVVGSMNEGIVLLNDKRDILSINESAAHAFSADESCAGKDILSINRELPMQELMEKAYSGEHAETVMKIGGDEYQLDASPVYSGEKISGVALLLFDVTDKTQAEQIRREFTANVSHELKTPLHSISGCAEIMRDGLVRPEDMQHFSGQIYNESRRMIALVDDIIRLSKLDEGINDVPFQRLHLLDLVMDAVSAHRPLAEKKGVTLSAGGDDAQIDGVPPLIREIINNLCDNAIKYNHGGGKVELKVIASPKRVTLSVSDDGIGIPEEHHQRVFERFYRVDKSHSKEIGGTGLGLSIVKHAAMLHHAEIELHSAPGKGTSILIHFPAANV